MDEIIIHGAFDADNFGDILLANLTIEHLNSLGVKAVVSGTSDRIFPQLIGKVRKLESLLEVRKARGLIYSGGGYWGEPPNSKLKWHLSRSKKHIPVGLSATLFQLPLACIGPGFGPLSYAISQQVATMLLNNATVVALRDQESMDYYSNYGGNKTNCLVTADMALIVDKEKIQKYHSATSDNFIPGDAVGIHLNKPFEDPTQKRFLDNLKQIIGAHPTQPFVVFQDSGINGERQMREIEKIASYLGANCQPLYYRGSWELCWNLSKLRVVVTNKLHVGIVSSALGKTVLAFPNHPKTQRFYKQIGREECCIPPKPENQGKLQAMLEQMIRGSVAPIKVPSHVLNASHKNYELITEFVRNYVPSA